MQTITLLLLLHCVFSSFTASAAETKICSSLYDGEYSCCCVIGNFGTCETAETCREISGECVKESEHFRCTAEVSRGTGFTEKYLIYGGGISRPTTRSRYSLLSALVGSETALNATLISREAKFSLTRAPGSARTTR